MSNMGILCATINPSTIKDPEDQKLFYMRVAHSLLFLMLWFAASDAKAYLTAVDKTIHPTNHQYQPPCTVLKTSLNHSCFIKFKV